jgi:hypothetical protein
MICDLVKVKISETKINGTYSMNPLFSLGFSGKYGHSSWMPVSMTNKVPLTYVGIFEHWNTNNVEV